MAHDGPAQRWSVNLRSQSGAGSGDGHPHFPEQAFEDLPPMRPILKDSTASQDTIRACATPPIDIPAPPENAITDEAETSFVEQFMRTRQPSVSFNNEVKLECGQRQSIDEPLKKQPKERTRGRSLLQAISDAQKSTRAHSESDRSHYDPVTGRHLPKYSKSPAREQAHIGEGRFPLLQTTVDSMARESHSGLSQAMSMTSESTMSPKEDEVRTPPDEHHHVSPFTGSAAFSYEEPKAFKRTASQRWREGGHSPSGQDFFARAGSLRLGRTFSSGRLSHRDNLVSATTPRSAASSYLRAFSMSSSTDGGDNGAPAAVDAEGQTIGEDYVLGKQIGWGGFSVIKEVTQITSSIQRKLAVKIVRRQLEGKSDSENEQAQAEFEHEVELWRFLSHPHILPLEAVYRLDDATFCFIPLNTGGTLFDLIRVNRQGLQPDLAKSYAFQVASALRYLHLDARVVHRDIKLENCLIDEDARNPDGPGLVRLCDFGMAEWLSKDGESSSSDPPSPNLYAADRPPLKHIGPADTSTSAFAGGSLEYAAPEILRKSQSLSSNESEEDSGMTGAERSIVSPGVDIWAFGVCLYSLIVGSRPFQDAFQPRVVMAILAGDWDRERLVLKGGDDLHDLVSCCLEMDEHRRWDITRVMDSVWLEDAVGRDGEGSENGWKF